MCEVEAVINGRPLTHLTDDPRDLETLTPNHLLLGRNGRRLPPGLFVEGDVHSRREWRRVQYLADVFRRRWVREYLPSLQLRQKWQRSSCNLKQDDIVLVMDANTPRNQGSLGIVLEVYPGRDGLVRSVKIRTRSTTLTRPITTISKLCRLETFDR